MIERLPEGERRGVWTTTVNDNGSVNSWLIFAPICSTGVLVIFGVLKVC
jgi:hypothetical protein